MHCFQLEPGCCLSLLRHYIKDKVYCFKDTQGPVRSTCAVPDGSDLWVPPNLHAMKADKLDFKWLEE